MKAQFRVGVSGRRATAVHVAHIKVHGAAWGVLLDGLAPAGTAGDGGGGEAQDLRGRGRNGTSGRLGAGVAEAEGGAGPVVAIRAVPRLSLSSSD